MSDGMSTSSHFYFTSFFFEVKLQFFYKQQNSHSINYLEDTLSTYIEVAEFYFLYTYTSESQ